MKMFSLTRAFALGTALLIAGVAQAQTNVTPNLGAGVGSFYTDRYNPASFAVNAGVVQGRSDVLQIEINSTTDLANRPGPFQSTFYNTQGRKLDVNTTGSWLFESDLFVESSWQTPGSGLVRTDLWATQCNGVCTPNVNGVNVTDFPIIGFTNQGAGGARFRGWTSAGWTNFGSAVNFGAWNTLTMSFDAVGNQFSYAVNGTPIFSFAGNGPSTVVSNIMYQAYNWNDPAVSQLGNAAYTANWSNTPGTVVPEPSTYALMSAGLAGIFGVARRRRKNKSSSVSPSSPLAS